MSLLGALDNKEINKFSSPSFFFLFQNKNKPPSQHPACILIILFWYYFLVRGKPNKPIQMSEQEVRGLCLKSREIFLQQPILLELEAPLKICGELNDDDDICCSTLIDVKVNFLLEMNY